MDELTHHGIKGQKWGVRHGPPYPLKQGAKSSRKSVSKKDVVSHKPTSRTKNTAGSVKQKASQFEKDIVSHSGESVQLSRTKGSVISKILGKVFPKLAEQQKKYRDYDVQDKLGHKVGTMSVNLDSKTELNVIWVGISSKNEGRGLGQSAMRTIIKEAKANGIKDVTLEVPGTSPNARHIYEKLGFKDEGKISGDDDVWGGLTKMRLKL